MSFLSELKRQRDKLKGTETVVTRVDGRKYIEGDKRVVDSNAYGFVVDTSPDCIPALVVDHLYIGSQDCADKRVLEEFDIKHVLSLGVDADCGVDHKFVQLLDVPESDVGMVLAVCLRFMRNAVDMRENVLVHCNAGVSRTAAVAVAYLMHYECMQYEDAYSLVKTKRPAVRPNDGFRRQLLNMKPGQII